MQSKVFRPSTPKYTVILLHLHINKITDIYAAKQA